MLQCQPCPRAHLGRLSGEQKQAPLPLSSPQQKSQKAGASGEQSKISKYKIHLEFSLSALSESISFFLLQPGAIPASAPPAACSGHPQGFAEFAREDLSCCSPKCWDIHLGNLCSEPPDAAHPSELLSSPSRAGLHCQPGHLQQLRKTNQPFACAGCEGKALQV